MLALVLISLGLNISLFVAYVILDLKYKNDKSEWNKKQAAWESDKDLAVKAVHMQWKQYVDKIRPPGQA